ncbi:iron-containing redox enzyme family protein [Nocardioides pyridinolyticus]
MDELDVYIDELVQTEAPIIRDIANGTVDLRDLPFIARRHYAEVRTFIDVKLPSRLRICPFEDYRAKAYFSALYVEEQGEFQPGRNHAHLFATFCQAIGLTEQELVAEFEGYWPNYSYLLMAPPSESLVLNELAISYSWESMIRRIAEPLQQVLAKIAGERSISDNDLEYFPGHIELDEEHEQMAREALANYATTDERRAFIIEATRRTLVEANPWVLPLHPILS